MTQHLVSAALLACVVSGPAFAESPPRDNPAEPAIVVTGQGLAASPASPAYDVTELDAADLNTAASGRIEDVLANVAGFQQFRRSDSRSANPSAQGVTLRALGGNATSRTLVLLDGVPQADPFFGYIPLSAIPPETLGAVRVTRGGGAGGFGAGAVAGTIELMSANPAQSGRFAGSALVDDRGDTELSGLVAAHLGEGFAVASGRWDYGDGFWTTPESQRVAASVPARYDSWSSALRAVAPLAPDVELQARVAAFSDHRTLRFAGATSFSRGEDASLRLVGRGPWQFEALAYVQARDFGNVVISSSTYLKTLDQYATPSTGIGGKLELRPPVGAGGVLRLGTDLRVADGSEAEAPYSAAGVITSLRGAGGRNSDVGLYAESDWTVGPVVLTAGARADRWSVAAGFCHEAPAKGFCLNSSGVAVSDLRYADRAGWAGSFRGGVVVHAARGLSLRASAYSNLRQPTLNELYRSFTVFPVKTLANANLANERLVGGEVGADLAPLPGLTFSATLFDNRVRDAIANVTIGANLRERRNVDAVRARGVELGAALKLGRVSAEASYAYTDAVVEASGASAALNGMRPAQTPRHAASATLAWTPRESWRLALTLRHTGAQYEDDLMTDVLPAATTLGAYAEVPLGRGAALVLRGENLTDETVVTRNQAGSIDLGAPRTLWAGVKVRVR